MSTQQLHALISHLQSRDDAQLKQALQAAAATQDLQAVAAIAQQAGFAVEVADIENYHAQQTAELTDDQLGHLSGGAVAALTDATFMIDPSSQD